MYTIILCLSPRKTKRKEPTKETKETEFHLDELFDDYYKGHRTGEFCIPWYHSMDPYAVSV